MNNQRLEIMNVDFDVSINLDGIYKKLFENNEHFDDFVLTIFFSDFRRRGVRARQGSLRSHQQRHVPPR